MTHRLGIARVSALIPLTVACVLVWALPAAAITRAEAIDRAEVWVAKKVPYSQSRYAKVDGTLLPSTTTAYKQGYRTDCSGFVSMALAFRRADGTPYSNDTAGLGRMLMKITRSDLRPGDVILRPKDLKIDGKLVPYGHAVLFGGWADSTKTYYWGLHESSSSKGTVMVKIRYGAYGFWDDKGYAPYRYGGIRERARMPRTFGR